MATEKAVQMNVRLDARLKERGDEVLARFGVSSAELIRLLWGKIGQGGEALVETMDYLVPKSEGEQGLSSAESDSVLREGWQIGEEFCRSFGLDGVPACADAGQTWTDLYRAVREEHFTEKGLMS